MSQSTTKQTPKPELALDGSELTAVDRVVLKLNAICKTTTFDFAMAVGKLVVDSFYDGDPLAWRKRGPKTVSFRKLAKHPDLPMSPAALYRSAAIYELSCRMGITRWQHLSTSHLRVALSLPTELQTKLLLRAEHERWSVESLRTAIDGAHVDRSTNVGGRKRQPRLGKTLRTIARCLDEANGLLNADEPDATFSPEGAREAIELLGRATEICAALETRIRAHLPNARTSPPPPLARDDCERRMGRPA